MIEFQNVNLKLGKESSSRFFELRDISFKIDRGRITGIVGLSGSGKSAIVRLLSGSLAPDSGKILINGASLGQYLAGKKLQTLFQNNNELINPLRKANDIIMDVSLKRKSKDVLNKKAINQLADRLGLSSSTMQLHGFQLSGGEQQKLGLIRILAANPEIIILDEIFSAQDFSSRRKVMDLLMELKNNQSKTILLISHTLSIVKEIVDDVIILYDGKIIESGQVNEVFENPKHDYTRLLIKSGDYSLTTQEIKNIETY